MMSDEQKRKREAARVEGVTVLLDVTPPRWEDAQPEGWAAAIVAVLDTAQVVRVSAMADVLEAEILLATFDVDPATAIATPRPRTADQLQALRDQLRGMADFAIRAVGMVGGKRT